MSFTDFQRDKIKQNGPEVDDTTSFLRNASFNTKGEGSSAQVDAVTASDLLNTGAFDPSKLHPMAAIGDKLDYLLLDDEKKNELPGSGTALPSRGWSDDLCYGTGTTYLAGEMLSSAL
jgi:mitochondrial import inner membrane translocase subunit TIM23